MTDDGYFNSDDLIEKDKLYLSKKGRIILCTTSTTAKSFEGIFLGFHKLFENNDYRSDHEIGKHSFGWHKTNFKPIPLECYIDYTDFDTMKEEEENLLETYEVFEEGKVYIGKFGHVVSCLKTSEDFEKGFTGVVIGHVEPKELINPYQKIIQQPVGYVSEKWGKKSFIEKV
jgi:hypothetical protein